MPLEVKKNKSEWESKSPYWANSSPPIGGSNCSESESVTRSLKENEGVEVGYFEVEIKSVTSSIVVNPHLSIHDKFYGFTSCSRTSTTPSIVPAFLRSTSCEAYLKIIMSSFLVLSEGDTRNSWRDGQVCPDVGQGTMAPWARRPGCVLACDAQIGRGRPRDFCYLPIRRDERAACCEHTPGV
ncbi:hypothetical protein TNCV_266091 [Trichonephila clavipes]|nr:hypothetical protein TNCV_266091 [Trichonephila clavipes]